MEKKVKIGTYSIIGFLVLIGIFNLYFVSAESLELSDSEVLNLSVEILPVGDWYFDNINELRVSTYDGKYHIHVSDINFLFYNTSGFYASILDIKEIDTGVYIQEFMINSMDEVDEKEINIKVTIQVNNQKQEDTINIIIYTPSILKKIYFKVESYFSKLFVTIEQKKYKRNSYLLYIMLGIIITILTLLILLMCWDNPKKNKQ